MHVAINAWFWDQASTGSGQYLRGLVGGLGQLKADFQISLILPPHLSPEQVGDLGPNIQAIPTRQSLGGNLGKVWFEQRTYPAAVRRIGADIAHVPYWGAPLSSPAKMLVSILDVIPLALREYRAGGLNNLYTSLVRASAAGAGHIITLSEASKREIVEYLNIPPEKISPIYLAADGRFMPPGPHNAQSDEAVRQKYGLPDEFALYLGSYDRRKNIDKLLLAWTYVGQPMGENVPLVLAGRPPKEWGTALYPDLPAYAKKLEIQPYLMWLGEVAEADKPALYRLAKVFVYPSSYEGFGLPILEAMASGTPVVACATSSIPEVAGEAAYLVGPDQAREMGGAILAILVQNDLHAQLSNAGRGQSTRFSWRKTAQETYAVYEQLARA